MTDINAAPHSKPQPQPHPLPTRCFSVGLIIAAIAVGAIIWSVFKPNTETVIINTSPKILRFESGQSSDAAFHIVCGGQSFSVGSVMHNTTDTTATANETEANSFAEISGFVHVRTMIGWCW